MIALIVDLCAYLIGESWVAELLVAHAMHLPRMLGGLGNNLIIAVRDNDSLTIEAKVPAMEFTRHGYAFLESDLTVCWTRDQYTPGPQQSRSREPVASISVLAYGWDPREAFWTRIPFYDTTQQENDIMAFWDRLTSTKRPEEGIAVCTREEVRQRILSMNRDSAPFRIIDGAKEGVDLIAEWKIVDAAWYEIFAKAGLEKIFRIFMKLDEEDHEVRAKDHEYSLSWRAGVPHLEMSMSKTIGQSQSIQFGNRYGFTEELRPGEIYTYHFSTGEMKSPIQEAVTACGWTYKGVTFGKL